jgi:uncharacterized repeat protein (TIGR01451 family)
VVSGPGGGIPVAAGPPRLAIRKTGPARARSGATVSYVIRVTNLGSETARGVVLRDRIPAGLALTGSAGGATFRAGLLTWRIGDLRGGASRTVRARLTIVGGTAGRRCNGGSASATNADTVRATACTRVVRRPLRDTVLPAVTG